MRPKPTVNLGDLSGPEGNVYVVLGRCDRALRDAGWDKQDCDDFQERAKATGSYDGVLALVRETFDVEED